MRQGLVVKQKIVKELKENFQKAKSVFLISLEKLNIKLQNYLRHSIKGKGIFKVTKKTLLLRSLEGLSSEDKEKIENIKKPLALLFDFEDGFQASKILNQVKKEFEDLKILGGIFENKFLESQNVSPLLEFDSRNQVYQKLFFKFKISLLKFILVLKAPLIHLMADLSQLKQKRSGN